MRPLRIGAAALALGLLAASAPAPWPYLPGSRVAPHLSRIRPPYTLSVVGPGTIRDGLYLAPDLGAASTATVIGANASGVAVDEVHLAPAPSRDRPLLAVATYDGGVVLHDPVTFAVLGVLATGGSPSDVAFSADGGFAATDTSGDAATRVARDPWSATAIPGVPLGNEIVADDVRGAYFVSDREVAGSGALTRIARDGSTARIATGATAEGLALDAARGILYVGNVNDGTVLAVDAARFAPMRRIGAVPRVFGIALSADGGTLYAVANQSLAAQSLAKPGYVAAIRLGARPGVVARSADLRFPLGVAVDPRDGRIFVTDESGDEVYVLDAVTMRARHAPLSTCRTPWKPYYERATGRLYVPCARADRVDVFDAHALRRIPGAPFATGGYPLAVSSWRPR